MESRISHICKNTDCLNNHEKYTNDPRNNVDTGFLHDCHRFSRVRVDGQRRHARFDTAHPQRASIIPTAFGWCVSIVNRLPTVTIKMILFSLEYF